MRNRSSNNKNIHIYNIHNTPEAHGGATRPEQHCQVGPGHGDAAEGLEHVAGQLGLGQHGRVQGQEQTHGLTQGDLGEGEEMGGIIYRGAKCK